MENILHISDLHISTSTKYGLHFEKCKGIAQKAAADARNRIIETGKPIDTVIFSGDIAFSGTEDEYQKALDYFIEPLLDGLNLKLSDLYICPGNHDSNRSSINRFELKYRESSTLQDKNKLAKDIYEGGEAWERAGAFSKFRDKIDKDKNNVLVSNQLYTTYKISDRLHLLCLSSAWLAQDDEDEGNLFITESQIRDAIKSTPAESQRILVTHHPLNWLNKEDSSQVSMHIEKK